MWLSKTKAGQKITKAVKPFFDAAGKKAKCTWNRASNWLGEAFGYEAEYIEGEMAGDAAEVASDIGKVEKVAEAVNRYSGKLIQVNKADAAADALARRIGGQSRVRFSTDSLAREFDTISKEYIAQTKPALQALNKNVRNQMKATFEAAKETGRKVYYHFEGTPGQPVMDKLSEYSKRYGIDVIIDTNPLLN